MKKVFLIHGFEGTPNGGWRPYLMRELEKRDIYACALPMQDPEHPVLSEWLGEIERVLANNPHDEIYLLGHSLGGSTLLRLLETTTATNIKGCVFASTPSAKRTEGNVYVQGFLKTDPDWQTIKTKAQKFAVIHGDNDPLVPLSEGQAIADNLGCEIVVIPNGKHLNGSAGFTELPQALELVLKILD